MLRPSAGVQCAQNAGEEDAVPNCLFSLFATWFPVVVSQYCLHAQLRSPPRRSGRAPLTHPAPSRYLSTARPPRDIAIKSVKRAGDASGFCSVNALNFAQLK